MLRLHHAPRSRSSRIVWLFEELGADYEIVYTNIERQDGSGGEDEANPHPDKKVPALIHDGKLITESAAIVLYLTDLFPQADLGPQPGEPKRGEYLAWLFYYSGVIEPVVTFEFAGIGEHPALIRTFRGKAEMERRLLDALKHNPYLLGDHFTGADLLVASLGAWARPMLPTGKLVDDYLARCNARPALKASFAKDFSKVSWSCAMADIVNLNDRRKKKAKEEKAAKASTNRAKFGRTKGEKKREETERSAEIRRLDGAKRERDDDKA